jgi:hypothetical protein
MSFLDQIGQKLKMEGAKLLKPNPGQYSMKTDLIDRFESVDEQALADRGEAMLSFIRERCIRGNARNFQIMLDDREAAKIRLDSQCHITCEPGFHKLYIKLDRLTSQVINVKAEAGKRYCFDIACTIDDGMIFQRVESRKPGEEE